MCQVYLTKFMASYIQQMKMKKTIVKMQVFLLMGLHAYSAIKMYPSGVAVYFHDAPIPLKITWFA